MLLSQAIRMGSLLVPDPRPYQIDRCAIGMALKAVGKKLYSRGQNDELDSDKLDNDAWDYQTLLAEWPWLAQTKVQCPLGCRHINSGKVLCGANIIYHMFDMHVMGSLPGNSGRWTIEQLADWIGSIEPPEPVAPEEQAGGLAQMGSLDEQPTTVKP